MQLFIKLKLDEPLSLPLSYHHIIQGIIYRLASSDPALSSQLHNDGNTFENRAYKLFCFSSLHGKSRVESGRIVFFEELHFEVRSVNRHLIEVLEKSINDNGITFGERNVKAEYVKKSERVIREREIDIVMISPVTVHRTDPATKNRVFYNPLDREFAELINDNFRRKYEAYAGIPPKDSIRIETMAVSARDKYVTKFKSRYITAWRGIYSLKGEPGLLTFLYDTGIGSNNSQGFGMFELVDLNGESI